MTTATIEVPPKLLPVFTGDRRIRGAYGGRGSGKTFTFALMSAVRAYMAAESGQSGVILCAREFMVTLKDSSMSEVKGAIDTIPWLRDYFDVGIDYIRTKNHRVEYVFCGLSRNLDSIKSKAKVLIAWVDEAEGVSEAAWDRLEPTVRAEGSEIWVTWNPEIKGSATDRRFRHGELEGNSMVVQMNYGDNPWFPSVLEDLRRRQQRTLDPDDYAWIWEGDYRQSSDSQIFRGKYRVAEFEPHWSWDGPYYGVDFGFAKDPTTGVKCWIGGSTLYIEYDAGEVGLELDETAAFLVERIPDIFEHTCRADSARPESISYLKRHGLPGMTGVQKWQGSVEDGVEHIKAYDEVVIHPRCEGTINEFRMYSYKVDRVTGDVLPKIVDDHNHYIDALRYALQPAIRGGTINYDDLV